MKDFEKALLVLEVYKKDPKWLIFFHRVDRLKQLEIIIAGQGTGHKKHDIYLNKEAITKRKYLESNRNHFKEITKTNEEADAVDSVVDAINENVWFYSTNSPEE